jgi:hypothetical protein
MKACKNCGRTAFSFDSKCSKCGATLDPDSTTPLESDSNAFYSGSVEFKTLKFENNNKGIKQKNEVSSQLYSQGWTMKSESIEHGHFKGKEACCLGAGVCLPAAFLAGHSDGYIVVTYQR